MSKTWMVLQWFDQHSIAAAMLRQKCESLVAGKLFDVESVKDLMRASRCPIAGDVDLDEVAKQFNSMLVS